MHPLITRFAPLAVLAIAGLGAAGWTAYATVRPKPVPILESLPPQGPWTERISASGLVEGDGNDTVVGVPEAALVSVVAVRVGQHVTASDLLFRLDDRLARADLAVAAADLATAQSQVARLEALPRREDAEPVAARVAVAEAQLATARSRRTRLDKLVETRTASEDEVDVARNAEAVAKAQVASAQAELAHARLPAWAPELASARAQVAAAQARIDAVQTRISRLEVRAPRAATVISTSVMVGALAAPGDPELVVLADLDRLLVRVEVDESQAWKLKPGLPGQGWLRGDRTRPIELRYERIEPRAAARRAIQGKPGERLDGRAVQVLYRLIDPPAHLRPGLLMDVDLQSGAAPTAVADPTGP